MKRAITVANTNNDNLRNKKPTFKNNVPFRSCISKIISTFIDNVKNIDIVMPMYDLLGYSNNYYIVSESLQNYRKGEVNDDAKMQMKIMLFIIGYKTRRQQQVDLTTKITGSTPADYNTLATYIVLLMKYLINFYRSPDLSLINWEIELNLSW